jgi:hypothetical protein
MELIVELSRSNVAASELISCDIIHQSVELLFHYPQSNVLHALILRLLENTIASDALRAHLFKNLSFLQKIAKASKGNLCVCVCVCAFTLFFCC